MTDTATLIGRVAALYLREHLGRVGEETEGTARFILDCLTAEQTAAVAREVLKDAYLTEAVDLKLPAGFLEGHELPPQILTEHRATYFRNAACSKPVLLLANTGDDEEQSLKELVPIGAAQLQDRPDLWVALASEGLPLMPDHCKWWERALSGLRELRILSLDRLAEYVLRTRVAIESEGMPIITALGAATPALHMPRDSAYFQSLNDKTRMHASRWRKLYETAHRKRACFLLKQTPAQVLLPEDDLRATFERVKDSIPESIHAIVARFIAAPAGWNDEARELAECEWESVAPLFDGFKRETFNLGQATLDFYDDRQPHLLDTSERDYLNRLIRRKTSGSEEEEDRKFYEEHRDEVKEDRKLKAAWDRFVFGKPLETDDFIAGLVLCLERLFSHHSPVTKRELRIRCDRATKKELRDFNAEAGLFFAKRYKGVRSLFGSRVQWDVGLLFDFAKLIESWKATRKAVNHSTSRAALQLKFVVELEIETGPGRYEANATQLIWKFDPNAVISGFEQDWSRLEENPLVSCSAHRKPLSSKGQFQTVDLSNVLTFVPAFGKDRGTFVAVYKRTADLGVRWLQNLQESRRQNLITHQNYLVLEEAFAAFGSAYSAAIKGFAEDGLASPDITSQAHAFATLIEAICLRAKGDRNREMLLRPLLQIGVVMIHGGRPISIATPWHPLRLAAIGVKARIVSNLIKRLLLPNEIEFGDARLFFKDQQESLSHPFYPEIVVGWHESQPELLSTTDVVGDYTLHESPLAIHDGLDDTNENPADGANCVVELVNRYLALQPHEHANLSVVLYNCDSARLPQSVVERIASMEDDETEVRCQIILRHRDAKRLRGLYEKIIAASDDDPDAFSASEATRDFMARLRIGIMADQAPVPTSDDNRPADLVFSQDVIARHARVEWFRESAEPVDLNLLIPQHWSRRRPAATDDLKSAVYLCCPAQTSEGWSYLSGIATFFKGDWDENSDQRWLPARQLDFRDTTTSRIFEETHNLANWVVNYDELLDRRQLLNQNVRVIRYKQSATQGRNVVISSRAPISLLRSMVLGRLRALNLELQDSDHHALAERFLNDAKEISGDIILRAARRGRNASELLGIVLSRYLIRKELGDHRLFGWYFLDDYCGWLGQREEQLADVLALSPEQTPEGSLRLAVIVTESKYIDFSGLTAKRRESQKQLRDTVRRINDALFGRPERLDRTLWLSRLSDLILDGVQVPAGAPMRLSDWRRDIREGRCEIFLRGYSHIFVSGPTDAPECSDFTQVADLEGSFQEVFGRRHVRQLVLRYFEDQDPTPLREELAGTSTWLTQSYSRPSEIVTRIVVPRLKEISKDDEPSLPSAEMSSPKTSESETASRTVLVVGHDSPEADSPWAYPGIDQLLGETRTVAGQEAGNEWLREIEGRTKGGLQQFQLQSKLIKSLLTPNAALLKFAGSSNLTVEQVLRRRSEFLTTHGLNIISVLPEPGLVSIAIERPQREVVRIQDIWKRWRPLTGTGNYELLVGVREDDGEFLFISPGNIHAPHTLVAGSTGSGKSVLVQNLVLGIAATNIPRHAKIVLIDPKQGVDYVQFEGLPHLEGGIIDQQGPALDQLRSLVSEMDARYSKFKASRTNSLVAYNRKVSASDQLPAIWVIHDEFAEWMLIDDYKEEVTSLVSRLGVKARAAGIHLIFAAQRPDANVMPMQLRANLGNRLILRVDSEGTSEIALGEKGAERLLGRGHLLAKLEGAPLAYAQVPFVDASFIERFVEIVKSTPQVQQTTA